MSPVYRRTALVVAVVAVLAAVGWSARPQPVTPAERVEGIAAELRCPVCQGLSVKDSPSETAREMRDLVAQRVAEGRGDDEIRAEFRRSYGEWVFLSPPLLGLTGLVWLVPLAALVVGGLFALGLVRPRAAAVPPAPGAPSSPPPNEVAALRERVRQEETFE
ncbi:MAG: cytochrome c-type biogenesis protein CcmH [Chloroflexota bacterium]|nr:cytochrome c-type biogenesis protein CcmH [Chloroflexota bacterium]